MEGVRSHSGTSRRGRRSGSITLNACLNGKRSRAKVRYRSTSQAALLPRLYNKLIESRSHWSDEKNVALSLLFSQCDAGQPCRRCASRIETPDCIHQVPVRQDKQQLMKKIEELEARNHSTKQILQASSSGLEVYKILELLRKGEPYEKTGICLTAVSARRIYTILYIRPRE